MTSILLTGIVIAVLGFIVYSARSLKAAEIEKATARESREVALERLETVEATALKTEAQLREKEKQEIENAQKLPEGYSRSSIGFYPERMRPKDPGDLN